MILFGAAGCQRTNENVQAARESRDVLTAADRNFVLQAEKNAIQERVLGNFAQQKSKNNDVKDYGKMLVKDHNDALDKLVDLMNKNGIPQPRNLPQKRSEAMNKLRNLSGPEFDRNFIDTMVDDHMKAVDTFRREATRSQNGDVRDYAKDALPTQQEHLKEAQKLQARLGTAKSTRAWR